MSSSARNPLAIATLLVVGALAGCASSPDIADGRARPADLADCRVGGESGPRQSHAPATTRDRRCNPQEDVVLWSNGGRDDGIKLDLKKGD